MSLVIPSYFAPSFGAPLTFQYVATDEENFDTNDSNTYSNVSIGTASATRTVIVVIGAIEGLGNIVDSVSIGGVSASLDVATTNAGTVGGVMAIARATVTTGTTANIVVDANDSVAHGQIAVYVCPVAVSVVDTDFTNSDSTSVLTSSISTSSGGFIIAGTQQRNGSSASTPSGWTSDVNNDWSTNEWFQSISRTTDGTSLTPNITGLNQGAGVAVSYGPA